MAKAERSRGAPQGGETAAKRIAGFLARYDPAIVRTAREARAKLRRRLPGAMELVYDNYNALVFAFAPSERASEAILSIALYPRWVTLFFLHGVDLPDPERRLQGGGKMVRGVVLGSAADLDDPAIRELIAQAVRRAKVPLPAGRGRTVVRSVSAVQRPRRPSRHA